MKFKNYSGHQGDIQFFAIESIPSNAKSVKKTFFAKSEKSGHCHALCGDYDLYEVEGGHIVDVKSEGAILNHTQLSNLTKEYWDKKELKKVADHNASFFEKGIYYFGIQRRKKPFSKVWEKVID